MLGAHAADPGAGAFMYDISDEDSTGTFWIDEFNPVKKVETAAFDTGILPADGDANALAFDTLRNQLFFVAGDDNLDLKLYLFNIDSKTMSASSPTTPTLAWPLQALSMKFSTTPPKTLIGTSPSARQM